jgi:hypothetical protein
MIKPGILRRKTKSTVSLVTFSWGSELSDEVRYCDIEEPFAFKGKSYQPNPRMELTIPKKSGTLAEERASIMLPFVEGAFEDFASDGRPFAPTRVSVLEVLLTKSSRVTLDSTDDPSVVHLFNGYLATSIRNPAGHPGQVRFEALSGKSRFRSVKGGILVSAQCTNIFGGVGCGLDLSEQADPTHGKLTLYEDVELTSFSGTSVVLTQVSVGTDLTGKVADFWNDGYWEYRGLRLKIRHWLGGNDFVLLNQPRSDLVGRVGTLVPGCSRFLTRCQFWGNESRFMGVGIGIPAYNPLFEVP